jgi:hypothetical protein
MWLSEAVLTGSFASVSWAISLGPLGSAPGGPAKISKLEKHKGKGMGRRNPNVVHCILQSTVRSSGNLWQIP